MRASTGFRGPGGSGKREQKPEPKIIEIKSELEEEEGEDYGDEYNYEYEDDWGDRVTIDKSLKDIEVLGGGTAYPNRNTDFGKTDGANRIIGI